VTRRGDVLPIGGVKEKVLAARAASINTIILPKLNERDLIEVPDALKRDVRFHFVDHVAEVLEIALLAKGEVSETTVERKGREATPIADHEPAATP
jgi:ATP-dependent Lon protease